MNVYHQGLDRNTPLTASGENFAFFDLNGHRWAGPIERATAMSDCHHEWAEDLAGDQRMLIGLNAVNDL